VTDLKDQHALAAQIADLERWYYKEARRQGKTHVHRITYVLGRHEEKDFIDADIVFQNPGVPRENPFIAFAAQHGVIVESDIGVFFQLCPFPIIGVTGTKGKTTTTTLLAEMCKVHDARTVVGGNIRISVLDALDKLIALGKKRKIVDPPIVLELSSWQLESLEQHRRSPHIAVITNIKEDHLNRYRDMDDYSRAKELNVMFQINEDAAILNADDARIRQMALRTMSKIWWFSEKQQEKRGCFMRGNRAIFADGVAEQVLFLRSDIKLLGDHNVANVLAAACAAKVFGVPTNVIKKTIRHFKGVAGRLEEIAVKRGIHFINDTTATAPDASIAALRAVGGMGKKKKIILISGGADKKLHFDEWAMSVKKYAKHLVLFDGSATPKMEASLEACRANVPMVGVRSMREALREAMLHAKRGDVVLLSPGCASFGVFQHEFDRGDQFVKEVKKIR
jgi:UDP-N-acetylmuramoylalanine--D-glutamate ligase